jgi:hypothetical protein
MRPPVDAESIRTFARALGGEARVRMTIYPIGLHPRTAWLASA